MTRTSLNIFVALFLSLGWSASAQSEIVLTDKGNPIDVAVGLDLSQVTNTAVRVGLAEDSDISGRYTHAEITLVRGARAVAQVRSNVQNGKKIIISKMLSQARSGDKIVVRIGQTISIVASKTITIDVI